MDEVRPPAVVIDDDPEVRHLLSDILARAGFEVHTAESGTDGIEAVRLHKPLLTTLDIHMQGIDGFETARRIRAESDTYIVVITSLADEVDAVLSFGAGADDVVHKPFRPRELRARFLALARRPPLPLVEPALVGLGSDVPPDRAADPPTRDVARGQPVITDDEIRYPGLTLQRRTRLVTVDGHLVDLTRTEFDLLETILASERRVRTKVDLALAVRDDKHPAPSLVLYSDERAIESHITNLRRKLGESAAAPRFIETVRGVGYRAFGATPAQFWRNDTSGPDA